MNERKLRYREGAELELAADLELVEPALGHIKRYLVERGFDVAEWDDLQVGVAEALNNAIIHGCKTAAARPLRLRWGWSDDGLEIRVRDPGHFVPPPTWHELPDDPLAESGRGGFLISNLFDHVEHTNGDLGHEITLLKRPARQPQPPNIAAVEEELGLMTQDLSDSYESLAALFNISELLATSATFDLFLTGVLDRLRDLLSGDLVYVRFHLEDGAWQVHCDRPDPAYLVAVNTLGPIESDVWTKRQLVSYHASTDPEIDDPLLVAQVGVIVCPISFQGTGIGLIVVGRREGAAFSAGQNNLVRTVADFVGIAYTTSELYRQREDQMRELRELEIAAAIQRSLLPESYPTSDHWQIYGVCKSALMVGGDFFDVMGGPDGRILVIIADVMGKGVPAAMFSSILRASLRARVDLTADPGELLTELNHLLADDLARMGMFITAEIAVLSADGRSIEFANAGHISPLVFVPGQTAATEVPTDTGMPLGILNDNVYLTTKIAIDPRQIVTLVTDGLYEVETTDSPMLGLTGLADQLPSWWEGNMERYVARALSQLDQVQLGDQSDDRTLVVITQRPPIS